MTDNNPLIHPVIMNSIEIKFLKKNTVVFALVDAEPVELKIDEVRVEASEPPIINYRCKYDDKNDKEQFIWFGEDYVFETKEKLKEDLMKKFE